MLYVSKIYDGAINLCNLAGQDPGTDGDLQVLWILWLLSPAFFVL